MRIRFVLGLLGALVPAAILMASACSNQGEGDPCDTRAGDNGNEDCDTDLVCTIVVSQEAPSGRCCPSNASAATTSACRRPITADANIAPPPGTDASNQPDTAPPDANQGQDANDAASPDSSDAADAAQDG